MRVRIRRRSNSIFVSPDPQQVLKLGEFHLSFALARLGVLGKNIEDEGGAVDDLGVHDVLKASALGGR